MKKRSLFTLFILFFISSSFLLKPSFNGSSPGCAGSGCHTHQPGIVSVTPLNNLQVSISLTGVQSGEKVAGELVDQNGTVVDFVDKTSSNPFTLSAPQAGRYHINAGYKKPSRRWDSTSVQLGATGIDLPVINEKLSRVALFPNHPNPFNSETNIYFSLPSAAVAELSIFSINGQEIRHLVRRSFPAGIHSIRWNGKDDFDRPSPSGIYLVQIRSGQTRMVQRIILAK